MNIEYVNSVITAIVGAVALVVYWLSKRHERRSVATIIVMDIRHAEQVVLSILERGAIDTTIKNVMSENNWGKYKHLFAADFSQDDFAAFNRFFEACVDISEARARMLEIFYAGMRAKAEIVQKMLLDIDDLDTPEGQEKRQKVIDKSNAERHAFEPNDPASRIFKGLQLMGRLSNTVAFEKLKAIANMSV